MVIIKVNVLLEYINKRLMSLTGFRVPYLITGIAN